MKTTVADATSENHANNKRQIYICLSVMIVMATVFRVYWMAARTPVISLEGSEYVRMADNLVHGQGLKGNFDGPETMYAPLYAVATAGLELIVRNAELAAHLVSLACGVAVIVPVFLIAYRMYGLRVGYIAAALIAFNPLFIALSGCIYNENIYLLCLLTGLYFGLQTLQHQPRPKQVMLSALFITLAYLSRPEAAAYIVFFIGACWVGVLVGDISLRRAIRNSLIITVVFFAVASPYIHFLYKHTNELRLEGKWDINYTIANRIVRGKLGYLEAAYGLNRDSTVAGPLLDPARYAAYTPYPRALSDKLTVLYSIATRDHTQVFGLLRDSSVGGVAAFGLCLVGLFCKPWNRRRLFYESIVGCIVISVVVVVLTASSVEFRYVVPYAGLTIFWVAKGIDELSAWAGETVGKLRISILPSPALASRGALAAALLMVFAIGLHGVKGNWLFACEDVDYIKIKQAGLWLGAIAPGPKRIACMATVPTYYAQGTIVGLPDAESASALEYLASQKIDFVFLDGRYSTVLPEAAEWLQHGIPDSRAHLIYANGTDIADRVAIYRWDAKATYGP